MISMRKRLPLCAMLAIVASSATAARAQNASPPLTSAPTSTLVRLTATLDGALHADGRTVAHLKIDGLTSSATPAAKDTPVSVEILSGDVRFARADGDTTSESNSTLSERVVTLGEDGTASVGIVPGTAAGPFRVRLGSGDVRSDFDFTVDPDYRKPLVTGLITTGVGAVPGPPGAPDNAPDGYDSRRGRVALYATGAAGPNTLVTAAYDTANRLTRSTATGPYIDDPNDRPFSTYGDASDRHLDALSRDHLYARVDTPNAAAQWGEFLADTGSPEATQSDGFHLLLDGIKVEGRFARDHGRASTFSAGNDVAYARETFNPNDLATSGRALHSGIVLGSETISIVTFDRRTGATLDERALTRNVDYTLDYESGRLWFIDVPQRFDANFNPQSILVQYEYRSGAAATALGGRLDYRIGRGDAVRFGAGYVNYSTDGSNSTTLTEDVGGTVPGGTWSLAHERGSGSPGLFPEFGYLPTRGGAFGETSGDLWRAGIESALGKSHVRAAYATTDLGYVNPFGGFSTPGLTSYLAAYDYAFHGDDDLASLRFDGERNAVGDGMNASQQHVAGTVRARVAKRVTVTGGMTYGHATDSGFLAAFPTGIAVGADLPQPTTHSLEANGGVTYRVAPTVDVSAARVFPLTGVDLSTPGQTAVQLGVNFPSKGRAYARQLWSDTPTIPFAAISEPLTRVASSRASTAVGFERTVGSNTTVDSEYDLENTASGADAFAILGIKERVTLSRFVAGDLAFRHANPFARGGLGFTDYGVDLTTTERARVRASLSLQDRSGNGAGFTGRFGAAGALSDDWSMLSDYETSYVSTFNYSHGRVGFAYRPARSDRSATLIDYDEQVGTYDETGIGLAPILSAPVVTSAQVVSLAHVWQIRSRSEVQARYAFKIDGEGYLPAHSDLFGMRLAQRIGPRTDVAGEVALLRSSLASGADTTTLAFETGYRLGGSTRVATGYNFTGSPDPTLSNATTHRGAFITMTTVVDSLFGWGRPPLPSLAALPASL